MGNNVVDLPYDDLAELDSVDQTKEDILFMMGEINEWVARRGVDINTTEYRHKAAVIMTQLQVILMGK